MKLNKKNAVVLTGLLGAATIAGTVAYYSGFTQTEENQFTIVAGEKNQSGAGTIEEPSWNPDDATDLQPNATVPKDPSIKSNLEYDAWAFIKVEMPTVSAQVEGDNADKVYDAFDYIYNSNDWILISTENSGKSDTAGTDSVYIYAYKNPLAAGGQTTTLFDEMTVPDYTKLLNGLEGSVDITGYLIQTEGFASYTDAAKELGFEASETDPGGEEDPSIDQNIAILRSVGSIRRIMASLSGQTIEVDDYDTAITNVKYFKRSQTAPEGDVTTENIEASGQPEVLMWFDEGSGTIYYYTEADKVALPQNGSGDMFNNFSGLISADLSNIDVSNANTLDYFFANCSSLQEINLSGWDVSNVTSIQGMFTGCTSLETVDLSSWNTKNLKNMAELFRHCSSLKTANIGRIDVSDVTTLSGLFYGCTALETIDLSNWNTGKVTDFNDMFASCSNLSETSIHTMDNWDLSSGSSFMYTFAGCKATPNWDGIFQDGSFTPNANPSALYGKNINAKMIQLAGTAENITAVTKSNNAPEETDNAVNISADNLDIYMWYKDGTIYYYSETGTVKLADNAEQMFMGLTNMTSVDLSGFDTSEVENMYAMFSGCSSLTELDLSSFDVTKVNRFEQMFYNCSPLTTINLTGWNTAAATNVSYMFKDCTSLKDIDLSHFDVSKVEDFTDMFKRCTALSETSVASMNDWNINKSAIFTDIFNDCTIKPTWDGTFDDQGTFIPN